MLHVGRFATVLLVILLARVASTDVSKGAITSAHRHAAMR